VDVREAIVRGAGHVLTDYQRAFLSDPSPLRAVLKARQTGFSWLFALEALSGAIAEGRFSIFVSLNREEASEKTLYAREMYETLPHAMKPRLLRAGAWEMRLSNGGRLLSFPCRAPRGKANADLYLDEMAFYPNSEAVYTGALPVVSHGGRVTLASTPSGDRGMFWRAVLDADVAGQYSQHRVPWWRAPWFCTDPDAATAAGEMETEERIRRFGTPVLSRLYGAMDRSAFQQEYELRFVDTNEAYIGWDEIEPCVTDTPLLDTWEALRALGTPLYAGMDIGRMHDPTEIVIVSLEGGVCTVRCIRSLVRVSFQEQEAVASAAMNGAGIRKLALDASGMGGPVGESLYGRFRGRIEPVTFTLTGKQRLASEVKWRLQNGALRLPRRQSLLEQIHSVRRLATAAGNTRLSAREGGMHHADQFWALALAIRAAQSTDARVQARTI
jgi:phage FluMu gp28-like protein